MKRIKKFIPYTPRKAIVWNEYYLLYRKVKWFCKSKVDAANNGKKI